MTNVGFAMETARCMNADAQTFHLVTATVTATSSMRLAFVGATGAGKRSVVNLISRFYEFQKGTIRIDGVDIRDIDLNELRGQIGVVMQDVFLFSGSLRDNVCLHDERLSDDDIWSAIRAVGAESFVDKLPGGLDHDVRERGITLSVGQSAASNASCSSTKGTTPRYMSLVATDSSATPRK